MDCEILIDGHPVQVKSWRTVIIGGGGGGGGGLVVERPIDQVAEAERIWGITCALAHD